MLFMAAMDYGELDQYMIFFLCGVLVVLFCIEFFSLIN